MEEKKLNTTQLEILGAAISGITDPIILSLMPDFKRFLFSEGIELDEFLSDIDLVEFPPEPT